MKIYQIDSSARKKGSTSRALANKLLNKIKKPEDEVIYRDLDERLSHFKYLIGEKYTIADIATFPWIARHEWHDIGLANFKYLKRWYEDISKREAVIKGYDLLKKGEEIPKVC